MILPIVTFPVIDLGYHPRPRVIDCTDYEVVVENGEVFLRPKRV